MGIHGVYSDASWWNWSESERLKTDINLHQLIASTQLCQQLNALNNTLLNKANLRDLIAASGLVILLKLALNCQFFSPCDLEIWWMTPKNNRAPLLCYFKLFTSFRSHWWIQTGVTVWKRLIWVKINASLSRVTLKFDGWHWKTIGYLFYVTSSFVHHFVAIGEFKLELRVRKRPIWVKFDYF